MGVIYGLYCECHDEVRYVGQTCVAGNQRWSQHKSNAKTGLAHPVYNWMRKHGIDNIQFRELEIMDEEFLNCAEVEWIHALREMGFRLLNLNTGGSGQRGFTHSAKSKLKMSKSHMGMHTGEDNGNWGRPMDSSIKEKISKSKTGQPWSIARRAVEKPLRGAENGHAKITEADVLEIRQRYASGESVNSMIGQYPVGHSEMYRIVRREVWWHI